MVGMMQTSLLFYQQRQHVSLNSSLLLAEVLDVCEVPNETLAGIC